MKIKPAASEALEHFEISEVITVAEDNAEELRQQVYPSTPIFRSLSAF